MSHEANTSLVPARTRVPAAPWERPAAEVAEGGIRLGEYVTALRRYAWLVIGAMALCAAVAVYRIRSQPAVYMASASVRLSDSRPALTGGLGEVQADRPLGTWTDPLLTQIQVLKSRSVLSSVVDRSGMRLQSTTPEFPVSFLEGVSVPRAHAGGALSLTFGADGVRASLGVKEARAPYGAPLVLEGIRFTVRQRPPVASAELRVLHLEEAFGSLGGGLTARPREGTSVIDIGFVDRDRFLAQRVVNAAAQSFEDASTTAAQRLSQRRREFVEGQIRTTDSLLAISEERLSGFRRAAQTYSSRKKFEVEETAATEVQRRRDALDAERRLYAGILGGVAASGDAESARRLQYAPEIAGNPAIGQIAAELARFETARDSLTTGVAARTAQHPDVQRLDALIAGSRARLLGAARSQMRSIESQIRILDSQRAQDLGRIQELPATEVQEVRLVRTVESLRKLSDRLHEESQQAAIAQAVAIGDVQVVDLSPPGFGPIGRGRTRTLAFALLLGLVIGGSGALLLDRLNTSVVDRSEVEQLLGIPVFATVPQLHAAAKRTLRDRLTPGRAVAPRAPQRGEGTALDPLEPAGAESYRMMMTNILFSRASELKTLGVTSSMPGEGKTTTSTNLAVAFAQQGHRVILVDADLRRGRVHEAFGLAGRPGLTEVLRGASRLQDAVRRSVLPNLAVLPAGTFPPNPLEFLGSEQMDSLLTFLREKFDMVIVDLPPVLLTADALAVSSKSDAVLMVVRAGTTDRRAAQQSAAQLRSVGAQVIGAVLNDPEGRAGTLTRYDYYSYGSNGGGD
jgi:tyrosine-protein kinase Etk/Wzc